jgi:hypothetical protein
MSNQYLWTITSMSTLPMVDGEPNYVVLASALVTGSNGATPPVTASQNVNVQFSMTPSSTGYTPYEDLTEEQVIGWVQDTLTPQGVSNLEASIDGQIESIVNPPVSPSVQALPWVS